MNLIRLGVNVDHVATIRQARGGIQPNLGDAALEAQAGGADSITIHLREDRRHIQDADLPRLKQILHIPLNVELSLNPGVIKKVLLLEPQKVCFVPERRQELTTEGGLNAVASEKKLKEAIKLFRKKNIEVSLFIDPDLKQIQKSAQLGAHAIEIHTGAYANSKGDKRSSELSKIKKAAKYAREAGLHVHAGHGLDYLNVKSIAEIPEIEELNIGHSIVSEAIFKGLRPSVLRMKTLMQSAR